jgi:RNA polymerase sigma-70 factor (ECF subfamily)
MLNGIRNRVRRASAEAALPEGVLSGFRAGREDAFAAVYERFRGPLMAFVQGKVHDEQVAEEIVQEAFLKAFRHRDSYSPEFAFSTWLWTIARNAAADWGRRQPEPGARVAPARGDGAPTIEETPCPRPGPEKVLERLSRRRVLRQVLGHLTRAQRRVMWLRVIHHLSYDEISRRMDLSLSAVKCLAYRSKQVLMSLDPVALGGMTRALA